MMWGRPVLSIHCNALVSLQPELNVQEYSEDGLEYDDIGMPGTLFSLLHTLTKI